ncbi:MAG: hypothetical protein IH908_09855, partial [Proteobacteria bacterium]|nr:hypothetical protein [Pseudomonadota bacterium]
FSAAGLPCTATAASREEIEALLAACDFPLVAKPRRGYGSRGVRVLFDRNGIEAVLAWGTEMVVQEYVVPGSWNKARAEITPTDVDGNDVVIETTLLEHDRNFPTVWGWPIVNVYHDVSPEKPQLYPSEGLATSADGRRNRHGLVSCSRLQSPASGRRTCILL